MPPYRDGRLLSFREAARTDRERQHCDFSGDLPFHLQRFSSTSENTTPSPSVDNRPARVATSFSGFQSIRRGAPCALPRDRKSTRLNSSHLGISYAVFCLKKNDLA